MLIKPFIKKSTSAKVSISSLPSNDIDYRNKYPAYFGTPEERNESIEIEGRLLMLPIMYKEFNLMLNKKIHDNDCGVRWAICDCQFAKKIRIEDLR